MKCSFDCCFPNESHDKTQFSYSFYSQHGCGGNLQHLPLHWLPGLIQLIWLARWVFPSSLSWSCKRTAFPSRDVPFISLLPPVPSSFIAQILARSPAFSITLLYSSISHSSLTNYSPIFLTSVLFISKYISAVHVAPLSLYTCSSTRKLKTYSLLSTSHSFHSDLSHSSKAPSSVVLPCSPKANYIKDISIREQLRWHQSCETLGIWKSFTLFVFVLT